MNSAAPLPEGLDRLARLIARVEGIAVAGIAGPGATSALSAVGDRYRSVTAIDPARLIGDAESLTALGDAVAAECAEHRAIAADWDTSWRGEAAEAAARQWHGFLGEETARVEALTAAAAAADRCGHDVAERLADLRMRVDRADREIPYADDMHLIDEVLAVGAGAPADSERVRRLLGIDGSPGPVDPGGPVDPVDAETRARHWLEATFVPAVVDAADAVLGWCEATADEIRRLLAVAGAALQAAGEIGSVPAGPEPIAGGVAQARSPDRTTEPTERLSEPTDRVPEATGEQARAVQSGGAGEGGSVAADSAPASASTAAGTTQSGGGTQSGGAIQSGGAAQPDDPAVGDSAPGDSALGDSALGDSAPDRADITELIDAGIGLGLAVTEFATAVVEAGTAVVEAGTAVVEEFSDAITGPGPTGVGTDPTGADADPTPTDARSPGADASAPGPVPAEPGAPATVRGGDVAPDSPEHRCEDPAVPPDAGHSPPSVGAPGTGRPSPDEPTAVVTPETSPAPPPAAEPPSEAPLGPERGELAQAGPLRPVAAI